MAAFVARRLVYAALVLAAIVVVVSLLLRLIPGDPVDVIAAGNPGITEADKAALRGQLGLDGSALDQVRSYVAQLAQGSLGESLQFRIPVEQIVAERLPATIELALAGLVVALVIAVPVGVLTALKRDRLVDYLGSAFVIIGFSIPSFLLGVLLIMVFSVQLGWLPSSGREVSLFEAIGNGSPSEIGTALRYLCLPAIALGVSLAAWSTRMIRSSMLDSLQQDYVRFARAKGLSESRVVMRHALRTALIPVVTVLGLQLGYLLSGAFIIENVFALPGLGRTTVQAILYRDYPMVQGVVLVTATLFLLANLFVDMLYAAIDPRMKLR